MGGDFTMMSDRVQSTSYLACPTPHFLARCVYKSRAHSFAVLPAVGSGATHAPDSRVLMLAFDREAQRLYTGSETGPVRTYDVRQESWSALPGIDATVLPRDLFFDPASGLALIAFKSSSSSSSSGKGGVRIFNKNVSASGLPPLDRPNADFSALAVGTAKKSQKSTI